MRNISKKRVGLALFAVSGLLFLAGSVANPKEAQAYCSGNYTCGAEVTVCFCGGEVASASRCSQGDPGCSWGPECDDGFQTRGCTQSIGGGNSCSAHCGVYACSGPTGADCSWVVPPPTPTLVPGVPTPTLAPGVTPTPTPGVVSCGDSCSSGSDCPPPRVCPSSTGKCWCFDPPTFTYCEGIRLDSDYTLQQLYENVNVGFYADGVGSANDYDATARLRYKNLTNPQETSPGQFVNFWETDCIDLEGSGMTRDRWCHMRGSDLNSTPPPLLLPGDEVEAWIRIVDSSICNRIFTIPDYTGSVVGRVWADMNGNGAIDAGDGFIQSPGSSCPSGGWPSSSYQTVDGVYIEVQGPEYQQVQVNQDTDGNFMCTNEPYYRFNELNIGTYTVSLNEDVLPAGWVFSANGADSNDCTAIGSNQFSCIVSKNDTAHVWFGIQPISCELQISTDPVTLAVGTTVDIPESILEINGEVSEVRYSIADVDTADFNPDRFIPAATFIDDPRDGLDATLSGNDEGTTHLTVSGTMTNNGDIIVCTPAEAGVDVVNPPGWWQADGGGIIAANGSISSIIPVTYCEPAPDCEPYLITDVSGVPGVPVATANINPAGSHVSPASDPWIVASSPVNGADYNYEFFYNRLSGEIKSNWFSSVPSTITPAFLWTYSSPGRFNDINGYSWFYRNGDLTISGPDRNLFTRNIVLFVEGDLHIRAPINFTDGEGFFMAVVRGNILIDSEFDAGEDQPELEGIYYTDGEFSTDVTIIGETNEEPLYVRGSVAAGSFDLKRDLFGNAVAPAEIFEYGPDILLKYPKNLKVKQIKWEEVAP